MEVVANIQIAVVFGTKYARGTLLGRGLIAWRTAVPSAVDSHGNVLFNFATQHLVWDETLLSEVICVFDIFRVPQRPL